jgi:GLPGLI family protein
MNAVLKTLNKSTYTQMKISLKKYRVKFLFGMVFLLVAFTTSAQPNSNFLIGYEMRWDLRKKSLKDTINEVRTRALLIASGVESFFFLDTKDETITTTDPTTGSVSFKTTTDSMLKSVKDFKLQKIYTEEVLMNGTTNWSYDTLHPQQWTITDSIKTIGGYACKMATCFFRGRDYTAWFSPDIALSNGPWKFGGLPGLIMEVHDSGRQVQWLFRSLKYTKLPARTKVPIHKAIAYEVYAAKMRKSQEKYIEYLRAKYYESLGDDVKGEFKSDVTTIEIY